jgi:hypothetical protein
MHSPYQPNSPSIRRGLVLFLILMGGLTLLSLVTGRPGDAAAGFIGMVVGGAAALVVLAIERIGTWLAQGAQSMWEPPSSARATPGTDPEA